MGYNGYTDKRKASNKKYLSKFINVTFRVTPEEKKKIEERAQKEGKSVNQFIKDAVLTEEEQSKN